MFLFFDAHVVECLIVRAYTKFIEVAFHSEILANITTFESAGKIIRHKPTNHITTIADNFTNDMKSKLILFCDGKFI